MKLSIYDESFTASFYLWLRAFSIEIIEANHWEKFSIIFVVPQLAIRLYRE